MAQIVKADITIKSAIAETLKSFWIGNANAEAFGLLIINRARERNELMDRDFMRTQLEHEIDRLVLFRQSSRQTVNPTGFGAQTSVDCGSNAPANLVFGHTLFGALQDR